MHFAMTTIGTEGDVRPFVAIALGLVRNGHRVTIATHADYEEMVVARGLGFRPIGRSFKALVESAAGRAWIQSGASLRRYLRTTQEIFPPLLRPWAEDAYRAALDADAVIAHPFTFGGALAAAEKKGMPAWIAALPPFAPSGEIEPVFYPRAPAWKWLRRGLGRMSLRSVGALMRPELDAFRAGEGLPPLPSPSFIVDAIAGGTPLLHLFSEAIVARPSDWPAAVHVTGFCFLDEPSFTPPPDLVAFMNDGPPPLYVGFGSMTGEDPAALAAMTMRAIARTGERAVLVTGWGGLEASRELDASRAAQRSIHVTGRVAHDWLLPRCRAVVHHGGAGTLAAGLRARRPTLVVAYFGDQPFWGHRAARLGVGPMPLLRRDLSEASLANAIRRLLDDASFVERAKAVGDRIAREDGVANAVALIEARIRAATPASR